MNRSSREKVSKDLVRCLAGAWLVGIPCPAVVVADAGLERSAALAAESAYAAVGWVGIQEGTSKYRGTGVLVSSEWVLTAAHNWLANAVAGLEFHIGGETYTAVPGDWVQHPGWTASPEVSHTQGADIALFHLSRPVTGVSGMMTGCMRPFPSRRCCGSLAWQRGGGWGEEKRRIGKRRVRTRPAPRMEPIKST